MNRTFTTKSAKACEYIKEFKALSVEVANLQSQIEKLEQERNKVAMKGQKAKDKLGVEVDKLVKGELGEFEVIINVQLSKEEGSVDIDLVNTVEQYKDAYRKRKLEEKK